MKLPFNISLDCEELKAQHREIQVANEFSGESCKLPLYAAAVYDGVKQAEIDKDYTKMNKGREWFQVNFTDEYYTLLD